MPKPMPCLTASFGAWRIALLAAVFAGGFLIPAQPSERLQIGYCGPLEDIQAVKAAGFDYFELRTSQVAALADADYDNLAATLKRIALPTPAAYWFVPAEIKLTGPNIDVNRQTLYLRKALDRVSRLGVRVIVFGSSGARQVPAGFSKREAFGQLVDFGKRAGAEARDRGIVIAIEPQRIEESNIINNTAEAVAWVEAVNESNVQMMIDYYHFATEKEDPAAVERVKTHLRHLHMANPDRRVMPLSRGEYDYEPFFASLRAIHYHSLIGIEAPSQDLRAEGPRAVAFLRHGLDYGDR